MPTILTYSILINHFTHKSVVC